MTIEVFSLVVLLVMFVVASVLPINLGIMGFVAAFVIGALLGGLTVDDLFGVFPGDLFILLAGVTFLFAIAQNNGTVDLLMNWGVRLVGGNVGLVPWIMFTLTTLVTGVGALSSAGVAIVAPVALRSAAQYRISPLLMGIMVVQGATAGSYSPISPFGIITNGVLSSRDLPLNPGLLFANSLVFNTVIAALIFVAFGGLGLLRRRITLEEASAGAEAGKSDDGGHTFYRGATLAGIAVLAITAFAFGSSDRFDIGFAAFVIGLILLLIAPREQGAALGRMPWPAILLIYGILTYVGVLDQIGTIEYMQDLIAGVGSPVVAALAASYVGGVISAFASTAAILGASIPLAEPILQGSGLSAVGVVSAIAISSAIVDISPLSTNGALLISCLQEIGVMTTDTCINYQSVYQPHLGEHVAWGDTSTVVYANSVLGARSNFEGGPAALAAFLTGRTPAYGFHLDENRAGNILVEVEVNLEDLSDWGALGRIVGEKHQDYAAVPVFTGLDRSPTADELKHLGASLASHGSMGMYHIVGVTPEARTVEDAFRGNKPNVAVTVTGEDLEKLYAGNDAGDRRANLVVFSAPQLSLYELKALSALLDGKKISKSTSLIVTTNKGYKSAGEELGYLKNIEEAGGMVLEGVCFYILDGVATMRTENGWSNLVTNSAKLANIIKAHKYNPILRPTEECVEIAVTGRTEDP